MSLRVQIRRDTLANWNSVNPVLAQGEVGWVIGTDNYKIGDGTTDWLNLRYIQFGEIPNNGTLTIQKNGTTIATFTANQAGDTTANIEADVPAWGNITGTLSNQTDLSQALASKLTTSDILNVLNSTAIDKALSANMGKELNDRLNNVESRGRFLSVWECTTGLPETDPVGLETGDVYEYQRGDYYIVGTVGTTNYRPNGSSYVVGTASTTVETGDVKENDTYIYDGSQWILQENVDREVTFASVAGDPYDNTNLASALNEKQDELTAGAGIDITNNTISNTGVRGVSTGSTNGTISVNTNGTSAEVAVAGLGTAAYTSSTNYATSAQGTKADSAIQGVKVNNVELIKDAENKVNILAPCVFVDWS